MVVCEYQLCFAGGEGAISVPVPLDSKLARLRDVSAYGEDGRSAWFRTKKYEAFRQRDSATCSAAPFRQLQLQTRKGGGQTKASLVAAGFHLGGGLTVSRRYACAIEREQVQKILRRTEVSGLGVKK